MYSLDVVFIFDGFTTPLDVCNMFEGRLQESAECIKDNDSASEIPLSNVAELIRKTKPIGIDYEVEKGVFRFFDSTNRGEFCGRALLKDLVENVDDADSWMTEALKDPRFVQARLYDTDYDYWQNAHDSIQYKVAGKSMDGLPLVSNGLPFPLEQTIVDTSKNPGLVKFRQNYMESLGSTMWLGENFFEFSGCDKEAVISSSQLKVTEKFGCVKIEASEKPFTKSRGEEKELQLYLHELLFGSKR